MNSSGIGDGLVQLPQDTQNSAAGAAGKIPQGRISILKGAGGSDDEGAAGPWLLGKEDADVSRYQVLPLRREAEMMGGTRLCLSLQAGTEWLRGRFCAIPSSPSPACSWLTQLETPLVPPAGNI